MWFIGDPGRLERERAAIAALMAEADWLQEVDWALTDEGRVKLDFAIVIGDQRFTLRMTYPRFSQSRRQKLPRSVMITAYPPPVRDASGNLCLQHRPDNWLPTLTGAEMIRSAHNLLASETTREGPAREVESDHRLTTARNSAGRRRVSWSRRTSGNCCLA